MTVWLRGVGVRRSVAIQSCLKVFAIGAALIVIGTPWPASAQIGRPFPTRRRPPVRKATWERFVSASGGLQTTTRKTDDTVRFTAYGEPGDFDVTYKAAAGPLFDIGGAVRVWRNLGVGAAVSAYRKKSPAGIAARIPHPFFFDQLREAGGETGSLQREELAGHLQALWMIPVKQNVDVAVFGGPSYFHVSQPFVGSLRYSETYPYDSTKLTGVNTSTQTKEGVGFNVGLDVTYMFTKSVGVGGIVRYSEARVTFTTADADRLRLKAGGPQAGVGVRFRF